MAPTIKTPTTLRRYITNRTPAIRTTLRLDTELTTPMTICFFTRHRPVILHSFHGIGRSQ